MLAVIGRAGVTRRLAARPGQQIRRRFAVTLVGELALPSGDANLDRIDPRRELGDVPGHLSQSVAVHHLGISSPQHRKAASGSVD